MVRDGLVFVKRLARVEVEVKASHQHEFNATALYDQLGFQGKEVRGDLTILFYTEDGSLPHVDESEFTLYDSRRLQPWRSREYRLYYTSKLVSKLAFVGDLFVVYREEGTTLTAIIARKGTLAERDLQRALLSEERTRIRNFVVVPPKPTTYEAGAELAVALLPSSPPGRTRDLATAVAQSPTLKAAIAAGAMPSTKEMASAAHSIALEMIGEDRGVDVFMMRALDAETALYYEIEEHLGQKELTAIVEAGELTFASVLKLTGRYHQSRKSRRGHSLQNHLAAIFDSEALSYTAQCTTENKEKPDFVMPGCDEYHDARFPAIRLRMVACKSRTRERWRQVLSEAARIDEKYLVTVDEDITDDVITNMRVANVRLFLPEPLIRAYYNDARERGEVSSIAELMAELKGALGLSDEDPEALA